MSDFLDNIGDRMLEDEQAAGDGGTQVIEQIEQSAATQAVEEPVIEQVREEQPERLQVPIQAMLDEREKRQEAVREAAELRRQLQHFQEQQQQAPVPDFYDDPEGAFQRLREERAQERFQDLCVMSANFAKQTHGEEKLHAAINWAGQQANPMLEHQFRTAADPYAVLIKAYNNDQLLTQLGDDPDAYVRRRYQELADGSVQKPAAQAATTQTVTATPPRSLARAAGSAGVNHVPPNAAWEGMTFALDRKNG